MSESEVRNRGKKEKLMAQASVDVMRVMARNENDISHDLEKEIKKSGNIPLTKWQKFRVKGQRILHGKYVLMLVVALCILDCCLVITELILDIHAVKDAIDTQHKSDTQAHDYDYHKNTENTTNQDLDNYHVTDRSPDAAHSVHRRASSANGHDIPLTMEIAHGCHFASVAILGVLLVYVILKVIFFGKELFSKKLEMFDAFVVLASFALDLAFLDGLTNGPIENTAFILSFFVPWRVLRVVNSLVVAILDHEHYKLVLIYKSKKRVEQTLDEVREELHESQNRVKKIKEVALKNGVEEWKINLCLVEAQKHDGKKHALSSFASFTFGAMSVKKCADKFSKKADTEKPVRVPDLDNKDKEENQKPKLTEINENDVDLKQITEDGHPKSVSGDSALSLSLEAEQNDNDEDPTDDEEDEQKFNEHSSQNCPGHRKIPLSTSSKNATSPCSAKQLNETSKPKSDESVIEICSGTAGNKSGNETEKTNVGDTTIEIEYETSKPKDNRFKQHSEISGLENPGFQPDDDSSTRL